MFNVEDILARLNKGESIESIAAEMTAVLNEANDAYAAAKETEDRKKELDRTARQLVYYLLEYLTLVAPDYAELITKEDAQELISLLVDEADALGDLAAMCAAFNDMKVAFVKPTTGMPENGLKPTCMAGCSCHREIPKEAEKAAEDVIAEFLRKNFLS